MFKVLSQHEILSKRYFYFLLLQKKVKFFKKKEFSNFDSSQTEAVRSSEMSGGDWNRNVSILSLIAPAFLRWLCVEFLLSIERIVSLIRSCCISRNSSSGLSFGVEWNMFWLSFKVFKICLDLCNLERVIHINVGLMNVPWTYEQARKECHVLYDI